MHLLDRAILALVVVVGTTAATEGTHADSSGAPHVSQGIYDFSVRAADGTERSLADFRGKTVLVVNTASRCGFTPQYASLEKLYEQYHGRGFEILAFPANNFLSQEPGTDAEIQGFCQTRFGTKFPVFAKISVRGKDIAPLYAWLTKESGFNGDIPWNFTKFLVGPNGRVVARFAPPVDPLDAKVTGQLEKLLAVK